MNLVSFAALDHGDAGQPWRLRSGSIIIGSWKGASMEKIDFSDLANRCPVSGYGLEGWIPSLASSAENLALALSNEAQALTALIDDLINVEQSEAERLVWIRDWTIWNERSQEIGLQHLLLLVDILPPSAHKKK
jgi:hypothetical protein